MSAARLRLRRLDTVQPEPVTFLAGGYLPESMLSLIVGDPGLGKTRLLLAIGAAVSRGWSWPEGDERADPANVLFCGHEDTLEHVIRPVFDALGGDCERFFAIDALVTETWEGNEREAMFTLTPDGLMALDDAMTEHRPRILLIDPITGHLGRGVDSFKDADVRPQLVALSRLGELHDCAIVANAHLNKATQQAALYRIGGSVVFTAVPRAVFFVVPDPLDPTGRRRVLFHKKASVDALHEPRGFCVVERDGVGLVAWDREPVQITLEKALANGDTGDDGDEGTEAEQFLRDVLANGPVQWQEIAAAARQQGLAERTVKRAKGRLRVHSQRSGFGPGSSVRWSLPALPTNRPHTAPAPPVYENTAHYDPVWPHIDGSAAAEDDVQRHTDPYRATNPYKGTPGTVCVRCGRPANASWGGEALCFGCHPLGTGAAKSTDVN